MADKKYSPYKSRLLIISLFVAGIILAAAGICLSIMNKHFVFVGAAFVIAAALVLKSCLFSRKNRIYKDVLENGITIEAVVTDTAASEITDIANVLDDLGIGEGWHMLSDKNLYGRESYRNVVICKYDNPVTGEQVEFRSVPVKECVYPYIGCTVEVKVNPDDYRRYFVEINSLLEKSFPDKKKPFVYDTRKD